MFRRIFFCFLILIFCTNSQGQDLSFKPKFSVVLDTSVGYWVLWQCSRASPKRVKKFWMPVETDIKKLEDNFRKLLQAYGDPKRGGGKLDSLNGYVMQYVGVTIKKTRYIYINAFSESQLVDGPSVPIPHNQKGKDWKKEPVTVCDGGNDFWGVLFNMKTLEFQHLAFNGEG